LPKNTHTEQSWKPATDEERSLVLAELEAILASYHFRGSKRYPALLRYVVLAVLEDRLSDLKERTLGVDVFARSPQYDTNADPVVRISAGEVRKRIAQYYHESTAPTQVRIELPLGSYVPEFLLKEDVSQAGEPGVSTREVPVRPLARRFARKIIFALLLLGLLATGLLASYGYHEISAHSLTAADQLLGPFLKSQRPILIVLGTSHPPKVSPETNETSFAEHTTGPYHHVSLATALALSNVAGLLRQQGRVYEVKEDTETSLTDLHNRPVILIGATNNIWTMRLVEPLRFHFVRDTVILLNDARAPENRDWSIDFSKPFSSIAHDYGMVARYQDRTTESPVLVVAGVGPYGTEAASEFLVSTATLGQLQGKMPAGWSDHNFQIILKTDIIDSKAGPPALVTSHVW